MLILIKTFGILIITFGIVFLLEPDRLKPILTYIQHRERLVYAGFIRIGLGTIFLLFYKQVKMKLFIFILGILLLCSGIVAVLIGANRLKPFIKWWYERPSFFIRIIAILLIGVGLGVILGV